MRQPTNRYMLRCLRDENPDKAVTLTIGGRKLLYAARCSFCMRSGPWGVAHDHSVCPLLVSMNKVRERAGYEPIVVSGGCVVRNDAKKTVNLQLSVGEVEKRLEQLEIRVATLEGRSVKEETKAGKRKATNTAAVAALAVPPSTPKKSRKRKAEAEVEPSPTKKGRKAKKNATK